MKINGKTIAMAAQYAAPYKGNFINSLATLEAKLNAEGSKVIYVLPSTAQFQLWFADFAATHSVYTTEKVHDSEEELKEIFTEIQPDLVHCHFEGYDIPVKKLSKQFGYKVVWHMHDAMYYLDWRKLYTWPFLFKHFAIRYGYYGRDVAFIANCAKIRRFAERHYIALNLRKIPMCATIPNGVDFNRLNIKQLPPPRTADKAHPYTFLAFGGRNIHKRIDLLIKAATILVDKGLNLRIMITNGTDTLSVVNKMFAGEIPKWCQVIQQSDNINSIFGQADCFVSTSIAETFSYAICEASIYGLPVIQSDIEGTLWNAVNPSTILFKSRDVKDLEEKMERMLNEDRENMAQRCLKTRQHNMDVYSLDRWSQNIIEYYNQV